MFISALIFLSNELLCKEKQSDLNIPLEFLTFAFVEGKLYNHFRKQGTFMLRYGKPWGNPVVYGAIFALPDYDFYIRLLDSYHVCSRTVLGRNHSRDIHHRETLVATPISFKTLDDLCRLKYSERDEVEVEAYQGNVNHPKINQRLNKTVSFRIESGVDKRLLNLIQEVQHEL
jgi:hypothetical protein